MNSRSAKPGLLVLLLTIAWPAQGQPGEQPTLPDSSPAETQEWEDDWAQDDWQPASPWQSLSGFAELARGERTRNAIAPQGDTTLDEVRLRLESGYRAEQLALSVKADALYEALLDRWRWRWRQAQVSGSWGDQLDYRLGRQILTWGTGDYLFLNDLFAKDWQAFFSGRDDQYLKAPTDALKLTWYPQLSLGSDNQLDVGLDLVYQWQFTPDSFLNGERFSFYSPQHQGIIAPSPAMDAREPGSGEWSARLFVNRGQGEYALYAHRGYRGTPDAFDNQVNKPYFPRLRAWGASLRRPLGPGLVNLEMASHRAIDDEDGRDPHQPNSRWLWLLGYEQEIASRLTLAGQYYQEYTRGFHRQSSARQQISSQRRHLWTLRLNYRLWQDKLQLGLFGFYSSSDKDSYLRPTISYRHDDHWRLSAGANLFNGRHDYSFFGQLADNSNAYVRLNYFF